MRRGRAWGLGLLLVVLVGLWAWWRRVPAVEDAAATSRPAPRWAGPAPALPSAPAAGAEEVRAVAGEGAGRLWLRATLLPVTSGEPFAGTAVVGVAEVREEDAREWEEARREGRAGAGPGHAAELATVREWRPAEVTPEASGGATLGPVEVPPAPLYRLLAWGADGTFYEADFAPGAPPPEGVLEAGALPPTPPTGLRVRLARGLPDGARVRVRLERLVSADAREAERASRLLPLLARAQPGVAAALEEGGGLTLRPGEEALLAPLPPDPAVRLRLFGAAGQEGTPLEVPLREGRVEALELDWERLLPAEAHRTVELHGRLLLEGSGLAPRGALVTPLGSPGGPPVHAGADGRFQLHGLPSGGPSRLEATFPPPASGRPLTPERLELEVLPDGGEGPLERTWQVPRYRWLVLRLDGHARAQLEAEARAPYPIFLLQRADAAGRWQTQAADHFLREEDGVAVSLAAPGRYRVLAAASPTVVLQSGAAEVGAGDGERTVRLEPLPTGTPCEVRVLSRATGQPVYGARVTVSGAGGGLPPLRGLTDAEGRFRLGRVSTVALRVEVEAGGAEPVEQEALAACRAGGEVRVEL